MSEAAFNLSVTFIRETCYKCGIPFAAPAHFFVKRREDHEGFFCPNGHCQAYQSKSEAERACEQRDEALRRLTLEQNRRTEAEKQAERLRKRVARGVCPCCKRTFVQLGRHMQTKHPEFGRKK